MEALIQKAFDEIGARLTDERFGRRFAIDIVTRSRVEAYQFQLPHNDQLEIEVVDVHSHLRQLVLDVTGQRLPVSGRYLCGHDESHWFVAGLEFGRKTATVRGAMESLKPPLVRREQRRKGIRHRLDRRTTAAYIRQGEWFFLPRPKMQVDAELIEYRGELVRNGGKPHRVDELFRVPGREEVFVRGNVRHRDHQTIFFDLWHRVVQNTEVFPDPADIAADKLRQIAWID